MFYQNLMDRRVQNRMLAFSVSELSLNQILKVQYERGDFHKTISKNDLDDEDKVRNKTLIFSTFDSTLAVQKAQWKELFDVTQAVRGSNSAKFGI